MKSLKIGDKIIIGDDTQLIQHFIGNIGTVTGLEGRFTKVLLKNGKCYGQELCFRTETVLLRSPKHRCTVVLCKECLKNVRKEVML